MTRIYLSPPHVGPLERQYLLDAFDSNWIAPLGPHVDAFERELGAFIGVRHVAALSSGTAALHLALHVLGVERDDDVVVSSFTFAASVNAIAYCGARPVLVDSCASNWNMDPELLREALRVSARKRLPKAVVVVDLYGQCADYDAINAVCAEYGVPVIEDAAEALGATYRGKSAGTLGRIGTLSFNGNKIITTSGGGAMCADDETVIRRVRHLATQAREPAPHYEHVEIGFNYRMSNLLAALGRAQLMSIGERIAARRRNFAFYQQQLGGISGIEFMPEASYGQSNRWLTCATFDEEQFGASREAVRVALEAENIESRPLWKPMHLQPVFRECPVFGGAVSQRLFESGLCLPSGSALNADELTRVASIVKAQSGAVVHDATGLL